MCSDKNHANLNLFCCNTQISKFLQRKSAVISFLYKIKAFRMIMGLICGFLLFKRFFTAHPRLKSFYGKQFWHKPEWNAFLCCGGCFVTLCSCNIGYATYVRHSRVAHVRRGGEVDRKFAPPQHRAALRFARRGDNDNQQGIAQKPWEMIKRWNTKIARIRR